MQNSWITTGEDSGVGETSKRPFSHDNADFGKAASAGEQLELVSIWVLFSYTSFFSFSLLYFFKIPVKYI